MSPLKRTIRELCFVRGAAILCAVLRSRLWRFDGAAALSQGPGRVLLAMLVVLSFASIAQATSVSYALRVTTLYEYGVSDHVAGPSGSPETGFARFTNVGISTLSGTFTLRGTAPNGGYHETTYVGSIAPNASLGSLSISYESSNDGGYNKVAGQQDRGIEIRFDGTATVGSISSELHLEVFDADVHSGVLRTNPFGVSTDAYVLQGGDPYGRDTGDDYELSQADGVYTWSMLNADCNSDGIVDSTQCRDGSLPDFNGNDIPDCCEQGSACVVGSYPVQWRVEDGGNGHWYALWNDNGTWLQAKAAAEARGGHLATVTSAQENSFLWSTLASSPFPCFAMLGGYQDTSAPDYSEPAGGWRWVTGEPFSYTAWYAFEPNDGAENGAENYISFREFDCGAQWNDIPNNVWNHTYFVEWSADCNNDGIVDYGQILNGQLADSDANGVPDICETLRVPQEYPTIQAAVDVAGNGATVLVGPGSYAPFDIAGKSIAIRSTQGAAATIIDGSGQGRSTVVFGIGTTLRTTLAGFTVRCGMGTGAYWYAKGGGCYIEHGNATFEDCDFTGGVYGCGYGGGILGSGGSFIVRRCRFLGTSAIHDAGGLQLTAGFVELAEQIPNEPAGVRVLVEDCTVTNCYGYNAGGMAIGLVDATEQQHEEVVLRRTMFAGNVGEYGPSSLFPSDLRLAGAAGGFSSHLFRVTNCVFGSGSLVFAMCGYWGEGFPLNTLVSDCVFPTGSLRRNCGELSIASSFFCNGTIPVTGAWVDLGGNVTTCPSNGDCDADGVIDFHQIVLGRGEDSNGNWILDACECPADIDGDGFVGSSDLSALLTNWSNPKPTAGDINGDGAVDAGDLSLMLASWGACR